MIANLFVPSTCALIQSLPRAEMCPRTRVGKHWLIRITVNRDFLLSNIRIFFGRLTECVLRSFKRPYQSSSSLWSSAYHPTHSCGAETTFNVCGLTMVSFTRLHNRCTAALSGVARLSVARNRPWKCLPFHPSNLFTVIENDWRTCFVLSKNVRNINTSWTWESSFQKINGCCFSFSIAGLAFAARSAAFSSFLFLCFCFLYICIDGWNS